MVIRKLQQKVDQIPDLLVARKPLLQGHLCQQWLLDSQLAWQLQQVEVVVEVLVVIVIEQILQVLVQSFVRYSHSSMTQM